MDSCGGGGCTTTKTKRNSVAPTEARGVCAHSRTVCAGLWLIPRGGRPPERGRGASPRAGRGAEEVDWTRRAAAERHQRPGHPFWCCATGAKRPCRDGKSAHLPSKDERNGSPSTRGDPHSVIFDTGQRGQGKITYDTFPFNRKRSGIYNLPLDSADTHASANGKLKLTLQRMRR